MFAVVEFMSDDEESAGEISIVPLCWLQKNDTKCYWPITTKKKSFSDFVKDGTPYKASWPSYKIFKVHEKTASYSAAEEVLETAINAASQSDSNSSSRSLVRRVLPDNKVPTEEVLETAINAASQSEKVPISESSDSEIDETRGSLITAIGPKPKPTMNLNKTRNISKLSSVISSASTDTMGTSEMSSLNLVYDTIAKNLASIKTTLEQHSIILNQLQRHAQLTNAVDLVAPSNLPDFPIKSHEDFEAFETLLENDSSVETYMTNRLAAVGGSGVDSLTRRILRYLLSNEVGVLFNWKGRDKRSFEKTHLMQVIYASAKLNFPTNEKNDLIVEGAVKDWLKYSKSRLARAKK